MRVPGLSGRHHTPDPNPPSGAAGPPPPGPPPSGAAGPGAELFGKTVLGRYRLARFLGAGSNADVYLAQLLVGAPGRHVVVKRIKPHVLQNPRFRQFFDNEIRSMARFEHPYAVRLLDASLDDPIGPCLVLEYINGVTLEDVLATFRRLPADHAARLLCQLCHALQAAHKAGIMHRDLKPANLMVMFFGTPQETLKVMDFGFAGFTSKPHIQMAELTGHGALFACGTPAYVSPEMVRGDSVDSRADVYSAGVILYELLAGRLPFEHHDQARMLQAHVSDPPPKFARVGVTGVPPMVEMAVQMALAKYPNERPQSARELAELVCRGVGVDLWEQTVPPGYSVNDTAPAEVVEDLEPVRAAGPEDRFALYDQFEALLPERLAAAKLRGFIEDVRAVAVASEPGLIRVRVDMPAGYVDQPPSSGSATRSGLMSWLSSGRKPGVPKGREPIELDLRMSKLDANRVRVVVSFRPLPDYIPADRAVWQERCEGLYSLLRKYVMAA